MTKRAPGGGLGISLEGTVDVEEGVEVRPHHYIRSILPMGPVGATGKFWNGDQLLEVRKAIKIKKKHNSENCLNREAW